MGVRIGISLGQRHSPSGLCVAEVDARDSSGRNKEHYLIRHLERLPSNVTYPDIAARAGELSTAIRRKTRSSPTISVDVTGLGEPIVELFRESTRKGTVVAVYFNHGDRRIKEGHREVKLGKAHLVSKLQALLQTNRLHLPRTPEAKTLAKELLDYEIHVEPDANEKYGAFSVGSHDELVTALGLALQGRHQAWSYSVRTL